MPALRPTIAVWDCDRTRPLLDGRVTVDGCDPVWLSDMPIETMFSRALDDGEFDVSELSFSNFLRQTAAGTCAYIGLPIFPSRSFRHGAWFVSRASGIRSPDDLRGRRVGVREYSMTAAVVARGILSDEYGVAANAIRWVVGDVDERERDSIPLPDLPAGFHAERTPPERLLSDMLMRGEIDALLAYKPPKPFLAGDSRIARLIPDYVAAEMAYARRTAIFPIMHLMGMKRDLAEREPWLAVSLQAAFTRAKEIALADLTVVQALKISLPWVAKAVEETNRSLGEDYWPYGVSRNRKAIEALARWHFEQGLSPRPLTTAEMFVDATRDS
jgi:4,5-dihydroxyphthalate decarboxylase